MRLFEILSPPPILYHGSLMEFDINQAKPMTHFGTLKAAIDRGRVLAHRKYRTMTAPVPALNAIPIFIYPANLSIKNPLKIRDLTNSLHSSIELADMLYYTMRKKISTEERDEIISLAGGPGDSADQSMAKLIEIVMSKGYDGFVYKNKYEDAGQDSWVVFNSSQISPAGAVIKTNFDEAPALAK